MKKVLLDGELILQGLKNEGQCSNDFLRFWEMLQSHNVQGYITNRDLKKLHTCLKVDISSQVADALMVAVQRTVQTWSVHQGIALDAIITHQPHQFVSWDSPTLSVTEFLLRQELELLLEQSVDPTSHPLLLPKRHTFLFPERHNRFSHTAVLTTLLLLPLLVQCWLRREQLLGALAIALKSVDHPVTSPISLPHQTIETDSQLATAVEQLYPTAQTPPATLAEQPKALTISSVAGIDICVDQSVPFDIRMEPDETGVHVRLQISDRPKPASSDVPPSPAATIYRSNNGQPIAHITRTPDGIVITTTSQPKNESDPIALPLNGAVPAPVATVGQTYTGHLVTQLATHFREFPYRTPASLESEFHSPRPLVTVRYLNRRSSTPSTLPDDLAQTIDIYFAINPNGLHNVILLPEPLVLSPHEGTQDNSTEKLFIETSTGSEEVIPHGLPAANAGTADPLQISNSATPGTPSSELPPPSSLPIRLDNPVLNQTEVYLSPHPDASVRTNGFLEQASNFWTDELVAYSGSYLGSSVDSNDELLVRGDRHLPTIQMNALLVSVMDTDPTAPNHGVQTIVSGARDPGFTLSVSPTDNYPFLPNVSLPTNSNT